MGVIVRVEVEHLEFVRKMRGTLSTDIHVTDNPSLPFELCIQIHDIPNHTRLEHRDFFLTRDELLALKSQIEAAVAAYDERSGKLNDESLSPL